LLMLSSIWRFVYFNIQTKCNRLDTNFSFLSKCNEQSIVVLLVIKSSKAETDFLEWLPLRLVKYSCLELMSLNTIFIILISFTSFMSLFLTAKITFQNTSIKELNQPKSLFFWINTSNFLHFEDRDLCCALQQR